MAKAPNESSIDGQTELVPFDVPYGIGYQAGDTVYIYRTKPVNRVTDLIKDSLETPVGVVLHDQTEQLRAWALTNNMPTPKDTEDRYHYVAVIGDGEMPTVWPTLDYMEKHDTLVPDKLSVFVPTVVYNEGSTGFCRFGHQKRPYNATGRGIRYSCQRCSYWRKKGIDLKSFLPTHCVNGHPLKDNRWLMQRHLPNGKTVVTERCVRCHNQTVMHESGYEPHN